MTLQDSVRTTKVSWDHHDEATEFENGLAELMPFLRNFARSLSRNQELVDDLVQATLAQAWFSCRSFTLGTNLKAWLFTILRNEFYSYQRRAWRQLPWDAGLEETILTPPGEQQWAAELSDTIGVLRGLPDAQRKALILVGVGGFSYEDAAALLSCAVGTVKSRVGRARQVLRQNLNRRISAPTESRPPNGAAMRELLADLARLSPNGSSGGERYG
jgi:RNA polymerase sigma-70 factor, ECF subfamily